MQPAVTLEKKDNSIKTDKAAAAAAARCWWW